MMYYRPSEEIERKPEKLNLSIPGLNASTNQNQKTGLKVLWIFMFIICTLVCVRQVSERISYFFTYPVVLTYEMAGNEFNVFPKITLCHRFPKHLGECKTDESPELFDEEDLAETFMHLWDNPGHPVPKFITNCSASGGLKNCLTPRYWTPYMSAAGMAYTVDITEHSKNISTWYIRLESNTTDITNYKFLLHDDDEDILYGCLTSAYPIALQYLSGFIYTKSQIVHENVPSRPCETRHDYQNCILSCMDRKILNDSNCRLPFMKTVDHLPLCDSCIQVRHIYQNFIDMMTRYNLLADCNCRRSCIEIHFEVDLDTREMITNSTLMVAFSSRDEVEFLREQRSYVNYSLFCEVGGIIGLYLGFCLLTFIEVVQVVSTTAYRQLTKKNGKPFVRAKVVLVKHIN